MKPGQYYFKASSGPYEQPFTGKGVTVIKRAQVCVCCGQHDDPPGHLKKCWNKWIFKQIHRMTQILYKFMVIGSSNSNFWLLYLLCMRCKPWFTAVSIVTAHPRVGLLEWLTAYICVLHRTESIMASTHNVVHYKAYRKGIMMSSLVASSPHLDSAGYFCQCRQGFIFCWRLRWSVSCS